MERVELGRGCDTGTYRTVPYRTVPYLPFQYVLKNGPYCSLISLDIPFKPANTCYNVEKKKNVKLNIKNKEARLEKFVFYP